MKKNYLLFAVSAFLIVMISSCSKDENSEICHPCHLEANIWAGALDADGDTLPSDDVGEIEIWDIANPDGVIGGDFCDQAKEDAESPTYVHPFTEGVLTGDFHGTQLTAAYYLAHSDDFQVHCEEHEDEDHDDHDDHDHGGGK